MKEKFKIGDRVLFDNTQAIICHFVTSDNKNYVSEATFASIYVYGYNKQIVVATDLLSNC